MNLLKISLILLSMMGMTGCASIDWAKQFDTNGLAGMSNLPSGSGSQYIAVPAGSTITIS